MSKLNYFILRVAQCTLDSELLLCAYVCMQAYDIVGSSPSGPGN